MGYPFHVATDVTTAKCAYCGKRIPAIAAQYRWKRDVAVLAVGHAGYQNADLSIDRIIETFCSKYCIRMFKDKTLTAYEIEFEYCMVELCGKGLHPMTAENSGKHPQSGKVHCKKCKADAVRLHTWKIPLPRRVA